MRKIKIIAAFVLAVSIFVSGVGGPAVTAPVYAAKSISDLKKDLQDKEQKRKEASAQKKEKQTQLNGALEKKAELEEQISSLQEDIDSVDNVIQQKNSEIENKQAEIEQLTKLIDENDEQLKQRMKAIYENGTTSYLEIIFESKGLSDFFTRISAVKDIMAHDKALIQSYVDAKEGVQTAKQTVENEKSEKEEAKTLLVNKKGDLKEKQEEKNELVADLKNDISAIEKMEEEGEKQEELVKQELAKALAAQEAAEKAAKAKAQQQTGNSSSSGTRTATPARQSSGAFLWPSAASTRVTSPYGSRIHPITGKQKFHKGLDIGAPNGSDVLAAADGTVVTSGWNAGGYGNYITINHGGGLVTLYGHNSKLLVSAGETVKKGQVIAKVGSTGNSTGPHIHFEVMLNGSVVNPYNYL